MLLTPHTQSPSDLPVTLSTGLCRLGQQSIIPRPMHIRVAYLLPHSSNSSQPPMKYITDAILNIILKKAPGHMGRIDGHAVLSVDAGVSALEGSFEGDLLPGARSAYLAGLYAS